MHVVPERNGAQFQPLTIVLRNIILEYHAGGGVLRELVQNADDAGASEIVFVLDRKQHKSRDVLHEGLGEYQGASLLAFNNKPFSRNDFDSLSRVGDSFKAKDPNSTGKFGRGFNSVYNWTDTPSILSGSSLLILDPHQTWSASPEVAQPGGPVYNFVKNHNVPQMKNQLSAFSSLLTQFDTEFSGTIIRLPLRTDAQAAKSQIVLSDNGPGTSAKDIINVFRQFSGELVETLLFLKNLESITLRIDDKIFAKATSTTVFPPSTGGNSAKIQQKSDITAGYRKVLVQQKEDLCEIDFAMNISVYHSDIGEYGEAGAETKQVYKYAITHRLSKGPKNEELQKWARSQKLFPWIGIATPLEGSTEFRGRLFNTLPLPIYTKHPVHIHGMFSITPNRRGLHFASSDQASSEDSVVQLGTKWNEWLFQECVTRAWVRNLDLLRAMNERNECQFRGWDLWPAGSQEGWKELGMGILGKVFEQVVMRRLRLLPTVCGTTGTREGVLFTLEIAESLGTAFQHAGVPIVCPPQSKRWELEKLKPYTIGLKPITPSVGRKHLTGLESSLHRLPLESRMVLLQFVMSDEDISDLSLCMAPLIPLKDGSFRAFGRGSKVPFFLSREGNEEAIFDKCMNSVDLSTVFPDTVHKMRKKISQLHKLTSVRMRNVEDATQYCKENIFNSTKTPGKDIIKWDDCGGFVDQLWKWINQQCKPLSSVVHSPLKDLWLLPLMSGQYRKLSSTITVLDVSAAGPRGAGTFILKTADSLSQRHQKNYCLYTGRGFSSQTSECLRQGGFVKPSEDIPSLMIWLVANSENFVDLLNDRERTTLLQQLSILARGYLSDVERKSMKDGLPKLALFREADPSVPSGRVWISLKQDDSPTSLITYVGVKNLQVNLKASNTIFIDITDPDTKQLVSGLGLVACPQPMEFFENYVVPAIAEGNTPKEVSRASLVEYALQNFDVLSQKSRDQLSQTEIVPVSRDAEGALLRRPAFTIVPNTPAASLFFSEEGRIADGEFYRRYGNRLHELGMAGVITNDLVLERIAEYGNPSHDQEVIAEKARLLINNCPRPPLLPLAHQSSRWIPARSLDGTKGLYSSKDCRDGSFERLAKYAMPLAGFRVGGFWEKSLGWDRSLPQVTLLKQLEEAAKANDYDVLEYLVRSKEIGMGYWPPELNQIPWIPSSEGGYYSSTEIFFDDFSALFPHFGTLDKRFKRAARPLFIKLGVQNAPTFDQLNELQDMLAEKEILTQDDLDMALFIVKEVGKRHSTNAQIDNFKAPDNTGKFHLVSKLTAGDPGSTENHGLLILNQGVSAETAKQLGLATFKDRYLRMLNDPVFEEEFAQRESPIAVIEDTLKRYPIQGTFSEYLANAEDSKLASRVHWIIDESNDYPKTNLLSPKLSEFQGPALFCYNDGVFSEADFRGIINVGIGSKRDDSSMIGKFGRGALTMYHWTSVPSFISGEYYVIFDPNKKFLPDHPRTKSPRAGMKIKLKHVREQWPEQLRPFEGILDFTPTSDSFPGTLFRFPLPQTKVKGRAGILEARRYLNSYYEEANLSLIFLKKIQNISFWDKDSKEPNWSVQTARSSILDEPKVDCIEITSQPPIQPTNMDPEDLGLTRAKWCIISGKAAIVPAGLKDYQEKERLEPTYSLAALLSQAPIKGFFGRHFVGLPLQKSTTLKIPVHVNADIVIRSNRQSVCMEQKEEGSTWNRWIFESCVAPLYLDFVECLTRLFPDDGYRHWPESPSRAPSDEVSRIVAAGFWKLVASSPKIDLYLPTSCKENEQKPKTLNLEAANFDLLDPEDSAFVQPILTKFGQKDIVLPNKVVQTGLREMRPKSMKSITPDFLLDLLRSSPKNSRNLWGIWGQDHSYSMDFFNKLLSFLLAGTQLKSFIGCAIVPLANCTLGTFLPAGSSPTYFVATTPEQRGILEVAQNLMIHPGLEHSTVDKLLRAELNITKFHFHDIYQIYTNVLERDTQFRKTWLGKVWAYQAQHAEQSCVDNFKHLPVYYGKVVGEPGENHLFICPSEFDQFTHPAILDLSEAIPTERIALESLKGIVLLEKSTFPERESQKESIRKVSGVYRLLKSIDILAWKNKEFIEEYITRCVPQIYIPALRKIFTPEIVSELLNKYPLAKDYLKQLPIWAPALDSKKIHEPVRTALLPPHPALSSSGMAESGVFIDANVAKQYGEQLERLGVKKMSLDEFLRNHVRVSLDQEILPAKKVRYRDLIVCLLKENLAAFSHHPLAVDGTGRFRMARSLYSSEVPTFESAFRELQSTHFLHPDFRNVLDWKHTPITRNITENSYLECARAIERRGLKPGAQDSELTNDARTVFEFLCWDAREMETWKPITWGDLSNISFVPITTDLTGNPSHRIPQMHKLIGDRRLAKMTGAIAPSYANIAWSQCPLLERPPSSFAREHILTKCEPSPHMVLCHLHFLSSNRHRVERTQITEYISDIRACYLHLQRFIPESQLSGFSPTRGATETNIQFSVLPDAEIWFNGKAEEIRNMSVEAFLSSWTCSRNLCIGLEYDSSTLRQVNSFLTRFGDLLLYCGVNRITAPVIPAIQHRRSDIEHTSILLHGLQRLRDEGQTFDVRLEAEGFSFPAHWIVLSAASTYFNGMFVNRMREANPGRIVLSGINARTVSALLDYIYTGKVPAQTSVSDIIDQLYAAYVWQLDLLKLDLEIILCNKDWIRLETVSAISACAECVGAGTLARVCSGFIEANHAAVSMHTYLSDLEGW